MGLREKARKSLETNEEELDAPVLLKVDAAEREEARAREAQLRKDLEDARKLSDAKTARIARHEDTIHGLQSRVKELDAASTAADRETKKALKELEGELKESRVELQDLRKNKAAMADAEAAMDKVEKKQAAVDGKEASLRRREGEVETLGEATDGRHRALAPPGKPHSALPEKIDAR